MSEANLREMHKTAVKNIERIIEIRLIGVHQIRYKLVRYVATNIERMHPPAFATRIE